MNSKARLSVSTITGATAVLAALLVSGCNWVDSAGTDGLAIPVTEVFLDDMPVGEVVALNEKTIGRLLTSLDTTTSVEQTFVWGELPLEEGNLESCAALPNFNTATAAGSLSEACTDAEQCSLDFERMESGDDVAEFNLRAPELKAPVGVRYQLTTTYSDGRESVSERDFCLIAINEAPVAENDTFVVLEGTREVFGADELNLLSNDSDDEDVTNDPLQILPEPLEGPTNAAFFELGEDGSFTYESSLSDIRTDQIDSFVYQVSDGVHTSSATATIRIVVINQPPELLDAIPVLSVIEGEVLLENLGLYFVDPEAGDLSYSLASATPLPDGGSLELTDEGVLSGIPDEDDVGSHVLTLIVSDGSDTLEADFSLLIEAAEADEDNTAPEYVEDTVFDQIILLGRSIRPVIPEFTDADGDILTYSIAGSSILPDGVEIDEETGIVSGRPTEVTNVRNLRIEATDPFGESAISEVFYIRVR